MNGCVGPVPHDSAMLTDADDDLFERDRWGRPLIPDPATGEMRAYDRTSTFSGLISPPWLMDYHLGWGMAAALLYPGEAARIALSRAAGGKEGKALADLVHLAGMNEKRDKGSARHTLVRCAITGRDLPEMTRLQARELDRVVAAVHSLGTVQGVEVPLVCDEWRCAGSADYVGVCPDGTPFVADLKTGQRHSDSLHTWAVQLVVYARSVSWRNRERGEPVAPTLPRLYIIHAPQDDPSTVDIIPIDPEAAKQLAQRAYAIAEARRDFRAIKPLLLQPVEAVAA